MLKGNSQMWLLGGWFLAVAFIVAWSVGLNARLSTTALLLAIGLAPAVVMLILRAGAPSPSVAEILRAVDAKGGRS
jgi:hypothetical protein